MQKYTAKSETEIVGQAILAVFESIQYNEFKPVVDKVLAQYGVKTISPDTWYPLQMLLDIYTAMTNMGNTITNFVSIGMQVINTSPFPPEVDSIFKAIEMLNFVYDINVRNFDEQDKYEINILSNQHIRVVDHSPFPHDLVYGYFYAIAQRFRPSGTHPNVVRTYLNETHRNDDGAVYDITW